MQFSTFWLGAVGKSGVKIKESLRRSVPCKREIGASVAANKAFQPTRLRRAVERGVRCFSIYRSIFNILINLKPIQLNITREDVPAIIPCSSQTLSRLIQYPVHKAECIKEG